MVAIGIENYSDMNFKDTVRNTRETGEFTVHIVDQLLVEQMKSGTIKFRSDVHELEEAGL